MSDHHYVIVRRSHSVRRTPLLRCYAGGSFHRPGYVSLIECLDTHNLSTIPLTDEWETVFPPSCPRAPQASSAPNCLVTAPGADNPHVVMQDERIYALSLELP